jgi:hypothetical protein
MEITRPPHEVAYVIGMSCLVQFPFSLGSVEKQVGEV